ncbi:MAG: glutamine--fructose-6-phosphate transaminase (isomerizing) [Desulfurococcales archaeon]|nr:glutamine--fructose-6-phosphate transaminase (isomerizing) [Desulfurococcales archaeon]
MCGIIGITSARGNVVPLVLEGLRRLEYRGYDSVGVALAGGGGLTIKKAAGRIDDFVRTSGVARLSASTCIGHTRWATHGPPTNVNAHPHTDCSGRVAVVHNGVIRNYASLREELEGRGHRIVSDTDTELVAHLIEEGLSGGLGFLDALARALSRLEGSYALAIIHSREPDRIYFARMRSPLILGLGEGANAVASDIPAVLTVTRRVVVIADGELGWISPWEARLYKLTGNGGYMEVPLEEVEARVKLVEWTPEAASKAGYPHYMIKEIYEQPQAVLDTFNGAVEEEDVERAAEVLASASKILVVGAGTSFHAGLVFTYFASRLAGVMTLPIVASEHKVYTPIVDENTVVVAVSQSGETYDTLESVREWAERGATIIGVTNVVGSSLDRESNITLYIRSGPEIGVAATKTYLSQIILLELLAVRLGEVMGALGRSEASRLLESLSRAPEVTRKAITAMEPLAKADARGDVGGSMYILGRGLGYFLAKEASLKVKEIAYMHAEAYPAGESKHGPIALVTRGFRVYILATSDSPEVAGNAIEMAARGGDVVVVKPSDLSLELGVKARVLDAPPTGGDLVLEPFSLIPYFQLYSYHAAVFRGYDPDKPRNLAKTVTVE